MNDRYVIFKEGNLELLKKKKINGNALRKYYNMLDQDYN
jgi:hypothetical protein